MAQGTAETAAERSGVGRPIITRPRLTDLLDASGASVRLLVAPAGYGKTTLARQWLHARERRGIWFRPTALGSDVIAAAIALATTFEPVSPGITESVRAYTRAGSAGEAEIAAIGTVFADSVQTWPEECVLVVDDYHELSRAPGGENIVDAIASGSEGELLVLSRSRPKWASARRILYGEIQEVGPTALAMNEAEAAEVFRLAGRDGELPGLVALAEGWPAVIALAALTHEPVFPSGALVPQSLHDYLAEELFAAASQTLQWQLCVLALLPMIDAEIARAVFGEDGTQALADAAKLGFITAAEDVLELHPLLRSFLATKLDDFPREAVHSAVNDCVAVLASREAFDEAAELAVRFDLTHRVAEVIHLALDAMLRDGRLSTLADWAAYCRASGVDAPVVDLVDAEIDFREGRWRAAERRAQTLAERLPPTDPLASRAYYRAGLSAHLNERRDIALVLQTRAKEVALTQDDLRHALWGVFVASDELEDRATAQAALDEFERLPTAGPEDLMRRAQARLTLASRGGNLRDALDSVPWRLLQKTAAEPVVHTAFLHILTTTLSLAAEYDDALDVAEAELAEARASHVHFARPHALAAKGAALLGRRDFAQAERSLRQAWEEATTQEDVHAEMNAVALLARLFLCRGQIREALELSAHQWPTRPAPGMFGDFLSTRALILAVAGDPVGAANYADEAERVSLQTDGQARASFARAVAAILTSAGNAGGLVSHALARASSHHNFDSFVTSARVCPELCDLALEAGAVGQQALQVLERWDPTLLKPLKGSVPRRRAVATELTAREDEILALIAQGLANKDIARALWIEETTVKAHVRSIFRKLGVRSRTEAALLYVS